MKYSTQRTLFDVEVSVTVFIEIIRAFRSIAQDTKCNQMG